MRGIAYALLASGALALGAMSSSPAAAGCYGDDCGYQYRPSTTYYQSAPRYERYVERPYYRDYAPSYRTTYYDRPSCYERSSCSYYERPVVKKVYTSDSYYDRPYYRPYYKPYYRKYYSSYRHHHYRPYYHTVRYGGGWTQTYPGYAYGPGYAYYGGCHTAYIPYGWTWYKAKSC